MQRINIRLSINDRMMHYVTKRMGIRYSYPNRLSRSHYHA